MVREVDVIIAVHDAARPIERAVASVLTSASVHRAIVVCHDLEAVQIRQRLGVLADDVRVTILEFRDGVQSPAGPFNHGLAHSEAAYVAVMGSDDTVTDGAFDAWVAAAVDSAAHMVIAPIRLAGGSRVPTPPTQRRRGLQGARDRLAFRAAPLGIISRERFGTLRFTEGVPTGEDLAYSTHIWFSDAVIVRAEAPAYYVIHDDNVRVTFSRRPVSEDIRAVGQLLDLEETHALSARDRRALAVKLWRVNLFGAVHYRAGRWGQGDRVAAAQLAQRISDFSPESIAVLSRAEGRLRTAILDSTSPDTRVDELSQQRRRFLSVGALVPVRLSALFAHDAPLRFSAATWLAGRS